MLGAFDSGQSLKLVTEGIPIYRRAVLIRNQELAAEMLAAMGDRTVCLLQGHGITVTGSTVEEATVRAIAFETFCRITWQLELAGKTAPEMTPEDIDQDLRTYQNQTPARDWRYYVRLLEYRRPIGLDPFGIEDMTPA